MNRSEAIKLLESEGWTKADVIRALEVIDFITNPDEVTIRRAISPFAGSELNKRQRLQAAQKAMVTKKTKEIERKDKEYTAKIDQYEKAQKQEREKREAEIQTLSSENKTLEATVKTLTSINDRLKKDNKDLKNIVDAIKLKLTMDMNKLLQYEDSEIRKAVIKLFKSTLG